MVFEGKGRAWRPTRWNNLFGLWCERTLSGNQGLLAFDPLLTLGHEFGFVAAAVGNGFADDDTDRAGVFEEGISRPKLAAVERDGGRCPSQTFLPCARHRACSGLFHRAAGVCLRGMVIQ